MNQLKPSDGKVISMVTGIGSIHREDPKVKEQNNLRPQPKQEQTVTFKGIGSKLFHISGKSIMVKFKAETGNKYSTSNKGLIEELRKDGYKEV